MPRPCMAFVDQLTAKCDVTVRYWRFENCDSSQEIIDASTWLYLMHCDSTQSPSRVVKDNAIRTSQRFHKIRNHTLEAVSLQLGGEKRVRGGCIEKEKKNWEREINQYSFPNPPPSYTSPHTPLLPHILYISFSSSPASALCPQLAEGCAPHSSLASSRNTFNCCLLQVIKSGYIFMITNKKNSMNYRDCFLY